MPKILVIDDEEAFRGSLMTVLEKNGYDVLQAPSGAIGVQLARAHLPDLVLCDVNMGGVGGNLTLYALRRDPEISSIPFVLMSGYLYNNIDAPPGVDRGADGFLNKPFSVEKLVTTIQGCLDKSEPARDRDIRSARGVPATASLDASSGLLEAVIRILDVTRVMHNASQTTQTKETSELASQAHEAASLLYRRIENCLLYAEIERLASDWQQVALLQEHQTCTQEVIEAVALEKARSLGRTVDLDLRTEDAVAGISADSLKKIVEELLDNAFRYSSPGSPVRLKVTASGENVSVSISDQGRGMTPEQLAQAGGPMPLDQVLLAQQGSGLGLIIARRLTELHRGTFIIDSKPGGGTTVTVSLLQTT